MNCNIWFGNNHPSFYLQNTNDEEKYHEPRINGYRNISLSKKEKMMSPMLPHEEKPDLFKVTKLRKTLKRKTVITKTTNEPYFSRIGDPRRPVRLNRRERGSQNSMPSPIL